MLPQRRTSCGSHVITHNTSLVHCSYSFLCFVLFSGVQPHRLRTGECGIREAVHAGITVQCVLPVHENWETTWISTRNRGSSNQGERNPPHSFTCSKGNMGMMGSSFFFHSFLPQALMLWSGWVGGGQVAQKGRVKFSCRPSRRISALSPIQETSDFGLNKTNDLREYSYAGEVCNPYESW